MFFRKDNLVDHNDYSNPIEYWAAVRRHFASKADHNKSETELLLAAAVISAVFAGFFVSLGQGFWLGKVTPAFLNGIVVVAIVWLRVRQPQRLWGIYRSAQRKLEDEKLKFDNGLEQYDVELEGKTKLLAASISKIMTDTDDHWRMTLPDTGTLQKLGEAKDD